MPTGKIRTSNLIKESIVLHFYPIKSLYSSSLQTAILFLFLKILVLHPLLTALHTSQRKIGEIWRGLPNLPRPSICLLTHLLSLSSCCNRRANAASIKGETRPSFRALDPTISFPQEICFCNLLLSPLS